MLTFEQRELIEDATGITSEQLRRLERMGMVICPALTPPKGMVEAFQPAEAFRSSLGCSSEAH